MRPDARRGSSRSLSRLEVRDLDRRAIEEFGLPGVVLMENAGRNAADLVGRLWPDAAGPVVIACGTGNNGGDGSVIARHLELAGRPVRILLAGDPAAMSGDAAIMFSVATRSGIPIVSLADATAAAWGSHLDGAAVVVDALLGTGAHGVPRRGVAVGIGAIVAWREATPGGRVFAVDLPSGLDCDSGTAPGPCVRADATGTFVAAKRGFDAPGAEDYTGTVHVLDIGAPKRLLSDLGLT